MSSHGDGGSPTMSSIFRRIPSVRERARRGSLGQISGGAAIHDAVAKGKIHLAKFILDAVEGQSVVNSRDSHGKTPLIRAMKVDDCQTRLKVAQLLIQHGGNVNHRDNMGRTALSYAAELHYNDVIKILVKNNVDPNIEDNNGNTPLIYCSMVGNATGISILTRSFRRLGLDVDKLNGEGMSALMTAAKNGYMECVRLLAHEGKACLDQRDQIKNMTAAEWAREGGCSTPEMEAFLPKIRRQSKPVDSSPTKQNVEQRSNLQKNESMESNCSSADGYSPRCNSKDSSSEELSPRQNCSRGTIAVPTPPTYRKNPQTHMDALSRRFHALHPIKNINDIPTVRKQIIEMKRASLPEVTNPDALHYQYREDGVSLDQDSDNRSATNNIFVKRTKPSSGPRRPLSAINRHSNQRQSKSFDGVTYERSSNSDEDLRVQKKMGKSLSNLYLENPNTKNLLNLSFLSRSTEALSPVCSSPDPSSMRHSVNSTTHINVDIDSNKSRPIEHMLRVDVHGQGGDQTPRLPPLSPKRVVTGQ